MKNCLKKLCVSKSYGKILKGLLNGTVKNGIMGKKYVLIEDDRVDLENFVNNEVKEYLYIDESIPNDLVKLTNMFGENFSLNFKEMVLSYVIPRAISNISKISNLKSQKLDELGNIYKECNFQIEKINIRYFNLPEEWKIDLLVIRRMIEFLEKDLAEKIMLSNNSKESLFKGLNYTIAFEISLESLLKSNKCCEHESSCIHNKKLSKKFIPKIDLYYSHFLSSYCNIKYNQRETEINITKIFVTLFRDIITLLNRMKYFEENVIFQKLFKVVDDLLIQLLKNLNIESKYNNIAIVINTLAFINQSIYDLNSNLSLSDQPYYTFKSLKIISSLERAQTSKIEKIVKNDFMRIRCVNLSQSLINYCENKGGCVFSYTEEVKIVFVEVILGSIFSKIIKIKIENNDIEKYIFEMCEIENYLSKKMRKIPAISLIKSYLKIISCPPEDPEVFVQNFLLHSGNNFNFNQIIGKFDDKTKTNILKEEYSKLTIKK